MGLNYVGSLCISEIETTVTKDEVHLVSGSIHAIILQRILKKRRKLQMDCHSLFLFIVFLNAKTFAQQVLHQCQDF